MRVRAVLRCLTGLAAASLVGCATFVPNVDGLYTAHPADARARARPDLVLIGDIGLRRGDDTVRIAGGVARALAGAPGAPVVVLGDVFYGIGLVGACPGSKGASRPGCADRAEPVADQIEAVLGPYRDALPRNPMVAIGGNHDFYGGEPAVRNACDRIPTVGARWRYLARGCELRDAHPVETLDLGDVVVFAIDSEPMIRDAAFRRRTIEALRAEIARIRRDRPSAWRLVATHHPLETYGSHNGATKPTALMKDLYWLRKSVLAPLSWLLERRIGQQDPYELRYRAYRRALYRLFEEQPIDAFVSGHDHSLQHVRIDHPGVPHQIISGAGTHRSPVQRFGLDLLWLNRIGRLLGLGGVLPAPRTTLEFGLGGRIDADDLSGFGFAVLTAEGRDLVVDYVDPWRAVPVWTTRIARP